MIVTGDGYFVLISEIKSWNIKQSKRKNCLESASVHGLCYSEVSSILHVWHMKKVVIFTWPMGWGCQCLKTTSLETLATPRMKGPLSWHIHEPSGHTGVPFLTDWETALMHKSSMDCFRHDLKGLLEKRWLAYVPHTGFILMILWMRLRYLCIFVIALNSSAVTYLFNTFPSGSSLIATLVKMDLEL